MALTGWGLMRMEVNDTYQAFLGVSWLYLNGCTFTLAKTLRDRHEADVSEARRQGRLSRGDRGESEAAQIRKSTPVARAGQSVHSTRHN